MSRDRLLRYRDVGLLFLGPLVLVRVAYVATNSIVASAAPSTRILVSSVLFLSQVLFFLRVLGLGWQSGFRKGPSRQPILAVAALILLCALWRLRAPGLGFITLISVIVPATCEELVFRNLLPNTLAKRIYRQSNSRLATISAIGLAQLSFAACHFVIGPARPLAPSSLEFVRLFAAGLIYTELVLILGVGITALIHAAANLLPYLPGEVTHSPPMFLVLLATSLGVVLLLSRRGVRLNDVLPESRVVA